MLESSLLCEIGRQNVQLDGCRQTKYSCSHHKLMPECVVPPASPELAKCVHGIVETCHTSFKPSFPTPAGAGKSQWLPFWPSVVLVLTSRYSVRLRLLSRLF